MAIRYIPSLQELVSKHIATSILTKERDWSCCKLLFTNLESSLPDISVPIPCESKCMYLGLNSNSYFNEGNVIHGYNSDNLWVYAYKTGLYKKFDLPGVTWVGEFYPNEYLYVVRGTKLTVIDTNNLEIVVDRDLGIKRVYNSHCLSVYTGDVCYGIIMYKELLTEKVIYMNNSKSYFCKLDSLYRLFVEYLPTGETKTYHRVESPFIYFSEDCLYFTSDNQLYRLTSGKEQIYPKHQDGRMVDPALFKSNKYYYMNPVTGKLEERNIVPKGSSYRDNSSYLLCIEDGGISITNHNTGLIAGFIYCGEGDIKVHSCTRYNNFLHLNASVGNRDIHDYYTYTGEKIPVYPYKMVYSHKDEFSLTYATGLKPVSLRRYLELIS